MYYDMTYFLYSLPVFLISLGAQLWITISFNRNSKVSPGNNITGKDAAEIIRDKEEFPVDIVIQGPKLSDHFDPTKNIVSISQESTQSNISNIAVVAHEFGHVSQKFSNSSLFKFRNAIVPIVNIGSNLGVTLIIVGLILNFLNLSYFGLILFSGTALFSLITVPIEVDATKRGLAYIKKYKLIPESKMNNAKSVLNAAAMTYVAGLLSSIMNVLYYASRIKEREK